MVKNLPAKAGDLRDVGSVPGLGRSPWGGHGNPLQYSCLENIMDRGAWCATVHGVPRVRHDWSTDELPVVLFSVPTWMWDNFPDCYDWHGMCWMHTIAQGLAVSRPSLLLSSSLVTCHPPSTAPSKLLCTFRAVLLGQLHLLMQEFSVV